ncbi:MAG TPA: hypothetical protein PK867_10770 [Pirellulales bacterium]|nr:hypothetical protein [Pirellulales bacterium]
MAVTLAMVALSKAAKISGRAICDAWRARWPQATQPAGMQKGESTFTFHVGELLVAYGLMPAPIPGMTDEQEPRAKALFWPNAAAEMRHHARHVIVTVVAGEGNPIDQMRLLTQATVALVDSCDGAIGVDWPSSELLFASKWFCRTACGFLPDGLPLPIWINFRVAKKEDGSNAGFTHGLAALGHKEFGPVIKDGDTIGEDANERIKVTYGPSSFGVPREVMRLNYSTRKSSGSRLTAYGYLHLLATIFCTIGFGHLLYAWFPFFRGSLFRHFVLVPVTLVFGVLLLLISDQIFERKFGWQAFQEKG